MYLVSAAIRSDPAAIAEQSRPLAKRVRRFNVQVQLALAAADVVLDSLSDPATAMLASLAPCCGGSPEARRWARQIRELAPSGTIQRLRVNPIHTLHAVDNLALSELSIHLGNRAHCAGVGGAPGQLWDTLDHVRTQMDLGAVQESLVMAGDQDAPGAVETAIGVATVWSHGPRAFQDTGREIRLVAVQEMPAAAGAPGSATRAFPHAARGLLRLVEALAGAPAGAFEYVVPDADGDGIGQLTSHWEVT